VAMVAGTDVGALQVRGGVWPKRVAREAV